MNKRVLAAVASATLLATGSAFAADMAPRPVYKAPPPITVFSWTGCYVGAYGGGAWGGSVDTNDPRSQGGTFAAGTFYNGGANAANGGAYSYHVGRSALAGGPPRRNMQTPKWGVGIEGGGGY